jgi:quinol monooxygenase YgiN
LPNWSSWPSGPGGKRSIEKTQPGCLQFELFRSAQDPATITAIERWSSEAVHERHLQGDHVKTLKSRFDGILAAPPEIVPIHPR